MTSLQEGRLIFDFDPTRWRTVKWDDHDLFLHGIHKLNGELTDPASGQKRPEGTKAVDFIGLDEEALYLFEVKDFRDHAALNAFRQEKELPLEVGLKVRDTISGLLGAYARRRQSPLVDPLVQALLERRPVKVVAWVAEDAQSTATSRKKRTVIANTRLAQLQHRLKWLTDHVWVDDPLNPFFPIPGVQARRS